MSSTPERFDGAELRRRLWRALKLQCPSCGSRGIFRSWATLQTRCPGCGLALERGEADYFIGAYLINLVVVELLFAGLIVGWAVVSWPDPPWDTIQWVGVGLMIVGAVGCMPWAKTTWLACDMSFRPPNLQR